MEATSLTRVPCPDCAREVSRRNLDRHRAVHIEVTERRCSKCRKVKPITEFVRRASCASGREHVCHACHRKRGIAYERRSGFDRAAWKRDWYRRNKADIDQYVSAWRDENPERVQAYKRRAYLKRRDDPKLHRLWNEHSRRYMALRRQSSEDVSARLLWQLVEDAVPAAIPEEVRAEAIQDLFLRVLDREVSRIALSRDPKVIKRVIARAYEQVARKFGDASLDAPLGDEDGLSLADLLDQENALW